MLDFCSNKLYSYLKVLGEGFPSGQRDQTVNLTAQPSQVRILLPPPCGCSSMVELRPSKPIAWVRFPSPAPPKSNFFIMCEFKSSHGSDGRALPW